MPRLNAVIKQEVEQVTLRRSPTLVEDRLDELQAFAAVLIEAAQSSGMDLQYIDDVTAQFKFALDSIVRFGTNAARMVQDERNLRRDAVADLESFKRQLDGALALVDHLQANRPGEIRDAVIAAVHKLADEYDANPDDLLKALGLDS